MFFQGRSQLEHFHCVYMEKIKILPFLREDFIILSIPFFYNQLLNH